MKTIQRLGYMGLWVTLAACATACGGKEADDSPAAGSGGGAGASGSGGQSSQAGQGGGSAKCEDVLGAIDPTLLFDDMEDANTQVAPIGGRNGSWWLSTDMTAGTITPTGNALAAPVRVLGGRCGSNYAMRVSGEGFTSWGASLIANMRYTTDLAPTDVSAFKGVVFWARAGELHSSNLRVQFQDGNTYPQGGVCDPNPGSENECYNGRGTTLAPLDTEWRAYRLAFDRMEQRDFGLRTDALDTTTLYAIEFAVEQNTVFDFWVDDIWFYE